MINCKCGEPVEAFYKMCKACWWSEDPRNEKNKPPLKKFRIEILDTMHYIYEVEAVDEAHARHLVTYGHVDHVSRDESSRTLPIVEIK